MRRGNNLGSSGESLTAASTTAHTFDKPAPRTPPGYSFTDSSKDCLLPLFAAKPRSYYTPTLLEVTLAEARKRADDRAAMTVCYPQDSTPLSAGQEVAS